MDDDIIFDLEHVNNISLCTLLYYERLLQEKGHNTTVLSDYEKECKTYGHGGYYIGLCKTKIDMNMILNDSFFENAIKESDKNYHENPPSSCAEAISAMNAKSNMSCFNKLYKALDEYLHDILYYHLLYRPPDTNIPGDKGGTEYQRLSKETLIGKS